MKTHSLLLVGGALSIPLMAVAESTRQLDSHQHGHATLSVAVDESELLIELESPSANIVGFEHRPTNDAEQEALESAIDLLATGEGLFQFAAAAECKLADARVEEGQLEDDDHDAEGHGHGHDEDKHDHDKHDDHDDEKHDHDDEKHGHDDEKHGHDDDKHGDHDDEKHDHHDDKHGDHGHDHDEEVHSDFHVVWSFECADTSALTSIVVDLFDHFGGIEELDAAVVGLDSQSAAELSADNRQLAL
jgi:hypothetical protein